MFPGNSELVKSIMTAKDPLQIKNLGHRVVNYNEALWKKDARAVLYPGLRSKFLQNEDCLDFLDGTGERHIVEASATDRLFGVGLSLTSDDIFSPEKFRGSNIQGIMLMDARRELLRGPGSSVETTEQPMNVA